MSGNTYKFLFSSFGLSFCITSTSDKCAISSSSGGNNNNSYSLAKFCVPHSAFGFWFRFCGQRLKKLWPNKWPNGGKWQMTVNHDRPDASPAGSLFFLWNGPIRLSCVCHTGYTPPTSPRTLTCLPAQCQSELIIGFVWGREGVLFGHLNECAAPDKLYSSYICGLLSVLVIKRVEIMSESIYEK